MGLTPKQYYSMTRAEFVLAFRGYRRKNWRQWEHTRHTSYMVYASIPRKKGDKLPSMKKFMPLPTDVKEPMDSVDGMSIEEMMAAWEEADKKYRP